MALTNLKRLLVANRGEIACRVMNSARALGLDTVAVHSEADARAKHVKFADQAVQVGSGSAATTSYLDAEAVLEAARATGADCIHPVRIAASRGAVPSPRVKHTLLWRVDGVLGRRVDGVTGVSSRRARGAGRYAVTAREKHRER